MRTGKVLAFALILAFCAVPSFAQSSAGSASAPAHSYSTTQHDSRAQTPKLDGIAKPVESANLVVLVPETKKTQITIVLPGREKVCYAIRSYNLEAEDSVRGITNLKSTTTCELATNVHLKDASGYSMQSNRLARP